MPLAPEPPPEQVDAKIRLSAEQSYANYLKYKQALEEEPDRAPWVIVWCFIYVGAIYICIVLVFGLWWFKVIP